jgi:hypothetical protein
MTDRANPFSSLDEVASFTPKAPRTKPVANDAIDRLSEEHGFPSRQALREPKAPRRKRRVHRTGRNRQFNIKATAETVDRFYKMADERQVPLGALLERALDALERAGAIA